MPRYGSCFVASMLYEFLLQNEGAVLSMTRKKSAQLAGNPPSSDQLKQGLPIFYRELLDVLRLERSNEKISKQVSEWRGNQLLQLGYTLAHVVHVYGAMCQSIMELATVKKVALSTDEFHDLSQCLAIAIASAITEYQGLQNHPEFNPEGKPFEILADEFRMALLGVNTSLDLIKNGTVGFEGQTGQALERSLKRIGDLIERC